MDRMDRENGRPVYVSAHSKSEMRTVTFTRPSTQPISTMAEHHLFDHAERRKPFPLVSAHVTNGQIARLPSHGKQSSTLERVPDLRFCLERKTGFEPATLTLAT